MEKKKKAEEVNQITMLIVKAVKDIEKNCSPKNIDYVVCRICELLGEISQEDAKKTKAREWGQYLNAYSALEDSLISSKTPHNIL